VAGLETVIIDTLAAFGIKGARDPRHRGVWVGSEKIAAIGVRITGQVTMHGFALNVRTDPADFRGIVPCGIPDRGVTSMHLHRPEVVMEPVKEAVIAAFCRVFGFRTAGDRLASTTED
jgi:lipoate-protein ligase B